VKTSITLPKELLGKLKDIEIINRVAERLNRESLDTLDYQQRP